MKTALDKDGRVQLYGILFDLDKATLQPESVQQLQHVVTLLKDNPDLKLEVQGHTDDQGSDDYTYSYCPSPTLPWNIVLNQLAKITIPLVLNIPAIEIVAPNANSCQSA